MKHEHLVQLKEMGFPGSDKWIEIPLSTRTTFGYRVPKGDILEKPTLSELIEACVKLELESSGKTIFNLSSWFYGGNGKEWQASSGIFLKEGKGLTPEEAVANLWLALKKKDS